MKCEIKHDGTMLISSETELESYALGKWIDENLKGDINAENYIIKMKSVSLKWGYEEEKNEG